MSRDPEDTIARLAHAFDPSGWKRPSLMIASVLLPVVLAMTVLQRAIVADSTVEWVLVGLHGTAVVAIVPILLRLAWRDWHAARSADQS